MITSLVVKLQELIHLSIPQSTSTLISVSSPSCSQGEFLCLTHRNVLSLISPDHLHGFGIHREQAAAHQLHPVGLVPRDHVHLHHLLD